MVFAVEYLPLDVIPQLIKGSEDGSESFPFVVGEEPFDVFEDEVFGFAGFENAGDVEEEGSSCFVKASACAGDRECLAGKATNEKIELWKGMRIDSGGVAVVVMGEVLLVGSDGGFVDFGVADAFGGVSELRGCGFEAEFESAYSGEH